MTQTQAVSRADFQLTRRFALAGLASIGAIAVAASLLLDAFVTERMVAQEGSLTREFVSNLLRVEAPLLPFIAQGGAPTNLQVTESFEHLAHLPDVLRVNLYDRTQRLIWSTDAALIGGRYGRNPELDRALGGALVAKSEDGADDEHAKAEHQALQDRGSMFVEIYVPVVDEATHQVIGALEFYKRPLALSRTLEQLGRYIAIGATLGGTLLFGALFGLVQRADRTIRSQQRQLVDQATLAALGEMSGAVAHGIRNPLASIRSSAELMHDGPPEAARGAAQDIMAQSDRLEAWVRELLAYTQPLDVAAQPVQLEAIVQRCLADVAHDCEQRRIDVHRQMPRMLPSVRGDAMLLAQVLRSLVANAIEALGSGGRIEVTGVPLREGVLLEVRDSGPGLTAEQLARVGQPFYTTKSRGLGVGLAMARRVVERCGGRLDIDSAPGRGTAVRLHLATA